MSQQAVVSGLPEGYRGEALFMVTLRGRTPMLQAAWETDAMVKALIYRDRPPPDLSKTLEQIAAAALYHGPQGELGVPGTNLFGCLIEAGRHVKLDAKRSISTADSTLLPSFLVVQDEFLPFLEGSLPPPNERTKAPWKVDVRRGNMDSGGKRIPVAIVRPKFDTWALRATLRVDLGQEGVPMATVRKLLAMAGRRVGLCSFNLLHRGPFGQFDIADLEATPVEETGDIAAA